MNISAKLPTESFDGPRYSIVAWAKGHEVLYYREFGSYQGEWLMVSYCDGEYYIWKGYYGSCSGCDHYESHNWPSGNGIFAQDASTRKFVEEYKPFLEVPSTTMCNLAVKGWQYFKRILPRNIRADTIEGENWTSLSKDIALIAKLKENLPIRVKDILDANDQEIKQRALKQYGYDRFCIDAGATTLDERGDNKLIGIHDIKLLSLKDSTTDRRYLLRVPPSIAGVQEGLAWTFGLETREYKPLVET